MRQWWIVGLIASLVAGPVLTPAAYAADPATATPIKHIVIIFGENQSFDHYFGTYPYALNPAGEPPFHALANTPTVNGYGNPNPAVASALLTRNPNLNPLNNTTATPDSAANPFRFTRLQGWTEDMDHDYTAEQLAFDEGLMDLFPLNTGSAGPPPSAPPAVVLTNGQVMGYFDGNTVTALWNYAQHFALNDNSFGTDFGPSTVGAINLISGQTNGVGKSLSPSGVVGDGNGGLTVIGDPDPYADVCSGNSTVQMTGKNIGDLLNAAGITWGWFAGGFNLQTVNPNGSTACNRYSTSQFFSGIGNVNDYVPHHTPFQYYASTANPSHTRPTSVRTIGHQGDPGNHDYDVDDFFDAVSAGNFPAVSFLKAIAVQDAHPGYSDPLDEQVFVVQVANFLQQQKEWPSTALVILYDDSDGWYDHQIGPIVNTSATSADALTGSGFCGTGDTALPGVNPATTHAQGRCGHGPRQPLLVISPWARRNFVDHTLTDQTSVIRFIEDNWLKGQRIKQGSYDTIANSISSLFDFRQVPYTTPYLLNEETGEPK